MSRFALERRIYKVTTFRPEWYWVGTLGWIIWFVTPIGPAFLTARTLRALEKTGADSRFWLLCVGWLGVLAGQSLLIRAAHSRYVPGVDATQALMRANVLDAQTASGGRFAGPRSLPVGDLLARLRDDPMDVLFLVDNWMDFLGSLLFAVGAVALMVQIDALATLIAFIPMFAVAVGNRFIGTLARRYRLRSRDATSAVGDFLTAAFQASLTVKVGGARPNVMNRFEELSAERAKVAVRDETWNEVVWTINSASADICIGIALVVASRRVLDVGQITLFVGYLFAMMWLPQRIGSIIVGRRRAQVSISRLDAGLAPHERAGSGDADPLTQHRALPILGGSSVAAPQVVTRIPLETLEVRGLTIESRNLRDIDFSIRPGTLTVISGPVGSGKTSLLRAILGTLELDSGTVRWNGAEVGDRAAFFTPPICAYVPQVPRLFAHTLRENLVLGHPLSTHDVITGIRLAAFDRDVADLPDGLETLIGARGVRLSGGQAQRAAAARAIAHRPELLVLDDLTSALDVETEQELWERLSAAGFTVLAASNRPIALSRADQIIALTVSYIDVV